MLVDCGVTLLDALIDEQGFLNGGADGAFECEHAEHWATLPEGHDTGWLDWDDAPAECRWLQAHNPCVLPSGHAGDHAFDWPMTLTFDAVR